MSEWLRQLKEGTLVDVQNILLLEQAVAEVERLSKRIAELENNAAQAAARIAKLKEIIRYLWDCGYLIDIHQPGCPEDDTCRCTRVKMLNKALEDA